MATTNRDSSDMSSSGSQDSNLTAGTTGSGILTTSDTSQPGTTTSGSTRRTTMGGRDMADTSDVGSGDIGDDRSARLGSMSDDTRAGASRDYWDQNEGPGPKVMAADTLQGDKVVNQAGETLGEIQDIMIDVPTGRVAYAVLSVGGFLGVGDKLFAIPWRALQIDPPNHQFILNVAKERLESAPGFDKDHWPSMADESWANEVHSYYGSQPYWE